MPVVTYNVWKHSIMTSENLSKKLLQSKVPLGIPSGRPLRPNTKNRKDFSVLPWESYFEKCEDLNIDGDIFKIYQSGNSGPVCFFLHGGGFSALSWAVLSKHISETVTCRCVAMDQRGHGDTHTSNDTDLSADVLANDVGRVIEALYGSELPPIVLIGHSMGGAIAVHSSFRNTVPYLVGLIIIDVVEGTALEALSSMQGFLRSRPSKFESVEAAIEYCCKSGQIRNIESAKVSVVGQLKRLDTNETATSETTHDRLMEVQNDDIIREEEEDDDDGTEVREKGNKPVPPRHAGPARSGTTGKYGWRIDLTTTEPYWKGWFEGLSQMFLACSPPKMLLLAGVDRLDRDLTIGQMQGKFQLELLPQCGHAVHEDCPDKVSERLAGFLVRYKLAESKSGALKSFPYFP